jgi:hypothetical protein
MGRIFYGWVITGLSTLANSLAWSARSTFALFYVAPLQEFGWGDAPRQPWDIPSILGFTNGGGGLGGSLVPLWLAICSIVPGTIRSPSRSAPWPLSGRLLPCGLPDLETPKRFANR